MNRFDTRRAFITAALCAGLGASALAQTAPSASELARYQGLHAAAATGDVARLRQAIQSGAALNARDGHGRTALHVAAAACRPW
jgi:uncharacterized protein